MPRYIYQFPSWPAFTWKQEVIQKAFGEVRHLQGRITGQLAGIGFKIREESLLSVLITDVMKSSEIEGEMLDVGQVRSSVARRLGIEAAGLLKAGRDVEGVVEMMVDATTRYSEPLDEERLFGWYAALFPTGYSGSHRIETGRYRSGEMQVVSGAMGRERIHYEAPSPRVVRREMEVFLNWLNGPDDSDPIIKAATAHFWFVIIHPFDDGNGRIARAISDMLMTRADGGAERYYSMSEQIMADRKGYYDILKRVQHSDGDITEWLMWFMKCLRSALLQTQASLESALFKAKFWVRHEQTPMNQRQRHMLNRLLDGFEGKLKSSKWAKMAKCSADTAQRDIRDLMEKGILRQEEGGGRSTNYGLIPLP